MGVHSIDAEDDQFAYRYDTQLLIERRDQDLVKIHFHTNEPWKVLEYCSQIGEIYDIVAGTFLVTGLTDDTFGSLSPDL